MCVLQVADYRAPNFEASGNMQQGMYIPKGRVWEELYDPIHILLRAVHRPEYQTSLDRFTEYVTQKNQQQGKPTLDNKLWPPFRPPGPVLEAYKDPRRILTTKIFHAVIWIGLYKAVHQSTISENVMALIVYLLEMALSVVDPTQQYGQVILNLSNRICIIGVFSDGKINIVLSSKKIPKLLGTF